MLRRALALLLSLALATTGCATAGATQRGSHAPTPVAVDQDLLADYVQRLPVGSGVRVERWQRLTITGTLVKATPEAIVVQEKSQPPRPPMTIPLREIARVTLDTGHSTALKIWAGVGITLTCLFVFSALLGVAAASAH